MLAFVQCAELGSWRLLSSNPTFITVIRGPLACSDSRGVVTGALQKNRGAGLQNDFSAEKCVTTVTTQKLYLHDYVQHPPPIEALFDANEHPDERIKSS